MRKLATLPGLLALFFAPSTLALGLGQIELHSALGQPLSMEIPIDLGTDAIPLEQMQVGLRAATDGNAKRLPAQVTSVPTKKMQAAVVQSSSGKPVIRITTRAKVDTPYVRLIVDLKSPQGLQSKEFTVLLDPPEFAEVSKAEDFNATAPQAADASLFSTASVSALQSQPIRAALPGAGSSVESRSAQDPAAQAVSATQATNATGLASKPLAQTKSAPRGKFALAIKTEKATLTQAAPASRAALLASRSSATTARSSANSAATMAVIEDDELTQPQDFSLASATTETPILTTPAIPAAAAETVKSVSTPLPKQYGPTINQETLWSISQKLVTDSAAPLSTKQMAEAIVKANPDAFTNGNIHTLKAGVMLTIPAVARGKISATRQNARKTPTSAKVASGSKARRVAAALKNAATVPSTNTANNSNRAQPELAAAEPLPAPAARTIAPLVIAPQPSALSLEQDSAPEPGIAPATTKKTGPNVSKNSAAKLSTNAQDPAQRLLAIQNDLAETIQRLDTLQSQQADIVNKTATLDAKQQNLQVFFDAKQTELTEVQTRLSDLNKQMNELLVKVDATQHSSSTGTAARLDQPANPILSMVGFGLLAAGLIGGLWYLRRRQWLVLSEEDKNSVLQYEEMSEHFPQSLQQANRSTSAGTATPTAAGMNSSYTTSAQQPTSTPRASAAYHHPTDSLPFSRAQSEKGIFDRDRIKPGVDVVE